MKPLPVTIITGVPGAGKTAVLHQVVRQCHKDRLAVIVNDARDVGDDARFLREQHPELGDRLVELNGGSICTELQEDLLIEVGRLAQRGGVDQLIIEAAGSAEPIPLAELFAMDLDGAGHALSDYACLDTVVTVVDAEQFMQDYISCEELVKREFVVAAEDVRTITDLLVEQIETSNVVLLNKADRVAPQKLEQLLVLLQRLNTAARVQATAWGEVDAARVLQTQAFRSGLVHSLEGWLSLPSFEVKSEDAAEGVFNLVYTTDRPFHPERLWRVMNEQWSGVVRSRGILWLATRVDYVGFWSQAAELMSVEWAAWERAMMGEEEWSYFGPPFALAEGAWERVLGTPRQELSIVGINVDSEQVIRLLDRALLTDAELALGSRQWSVFPDPFPGSSEFEEMY